MKRDLFRRYVWLVDIVRHAKKIQFEEIADCWMESALNDNHSPLALRTFHNHRHAIEDLFGIKITCDRGDHNRYYIQDNQHNETNLKLWMLQTLGYSDIEEAIGDISRSMILNECPDNKFGLHVIIEAIRHNKLLKVVYSVPTSDNKISLSIAPYCIRCWQGRWVLSGVDSETGIAHSFYLDRLRHISITDTDYTLPEGFDAEKWLNGSIGSDINPKAKPEIVRLKISGDTRDKVRTLPLHTTQKEVLTNSEFSVFEYCILPGKDFIRTVLSHGTDNEVIYPPHLREEIGAKLKFIAEKYSSESGHEYSHLV